MDTDKTNTLISFDDEFSKKNNPSNHQFLPKKCGKNANVVKMMV
jgi:hypothetical protein